MMDSDTTILFDTSLVNEKIVYDTIKDVYESLEERGYNPINQIVGYIISGDLGYISSYKEARNKISKLDRNTIVEVLLKNYLK
ncbi:MAG: IreB family regulatory phosphoprotein [Bacilli bacterium]